MVVDWGPHDVSEVFLSYVDGVCLISLMLLKKKFLLVSAESNIGDITCVTCTEVD